MAAIAFVTFLFIGLATAAAEGEAAKVIDSIKKLNGTVEFGINDLAGVVVGVSLRGKLPRWRQND